MATMQAVMEAEAQKIQNCADADERNYCTTNEREGERVGVAMASPVSMISRKVYGAT